MREALVRRLLQATGDLWLCFVPIRHRRCTLSDDFVRVVVVEVRFAYNQNHVKCKLCRGVEARRSAERSRVGVRSLKLAKCAVGDG